MNQWHAQLSTFYFIEPCHAIVHWRVKRYDVVVLSTVYRERSFALEREQYLLNFVGSRLEGGGSASMMSSAASSRAGTPQPSGYCDFVSIQLEWRWSCDVIFTSLLLPLLVRQWWIGSPLLFSFSRLCQVSLIFHSSSSSSSSCLFGFYTSFICHDFGPRLFSASIWYSYLSLSPSLIREHTAVVCWCQFVPVQSVAILIHFFFNTTSLFSLTHDFNGILISWNEAIR